MSKEIVSALLEEIRSELLSRLRHTRLAPLIEGEGLNSRPGVTDMGTNTGPEIPLS